MTLPIEHDRMAQLLLEHDFGLDADLARAQLESAALIVTADEAAGTDWGQAALLAIAATATRMFRGGVFVSGIDTRPVRVGGSVGKPLRRALLDAGCRDRDMPNMAFRIHVGSKAPDRVDLYVAAAGWRAIVTPKPVSASDDAIALAGAMAGAIAVSEGFRKKALGDVLACRRDIILSALDPTNPDLDMPLTRLPAALWLLGLGNLGQATMFMLGLLPFEDRREVKLLVQDSDTVGEENRLTQILTEPGWVGQRKARMLAGHAAQLGFDAQVCERTFGPATRPDLDDSRIALVGVDNLDARRLAADGRFDLVLDAGLGSTAGEIFDMRLYGFPGVRSPERAWPAAPAAASEPTLNPGLARLVEEQRLTLCGAMQIAKQSVGVPTTALVAAALQVAQLCRALARNTYCDFIDLGLRDVRLLTATTTTVPPTTNLPSFTRRA